MHSPLPHIRFFEHAGFVDAANVLGFIKHDHGFERNTWMIIEGDQHLPIERKRLWRLMMDPSVLAVVIPGCREMEQMDDRRYSAVVSARIGPVESGFDADFEIRDADFPNSYHLHVEGAGAGGFVTSDVRIELVEREEDGTLLRYSADTDVGGKLAAVGQRLVKAAARSLIKKGFEDLHSHIEQEVRVGRSAQTPNSGEKS